MDTGTFSSLFQDTRVKHKWELLWLNRKQYVTELPRYHCYLKTPTEIGIEKPTCSRCQNPTEIVLSVLCAYNNTMVNTIPLRVHLYGVHLLNPSDYYNFAISKCIQFFQCTGTVMQCTIDYYLSWYKGSCIPIVFYFTTPTTRAHSMCLNMAIYYK
jgi:hypothetical protein